IRSRPAIDIEQDRLLYIPGNVPNPLEMPGGCPFHPRCPHAMVVCQATMPPRRTLKEGHAVSCWLHENVPADGAAPLHAVAEGDDPVPASGGAHE
ncbi:MAG: oligopeptide/dipeptide ABC transporter ATP-binding protein, partial [Spirochaetota bacterium]